MTRHWVLLAALVTGGGIASAEPATTTMDTVSGVPIIDSKTQTEDVHFRTGHDDRMTVAVSLAGTGPYRFLVDTGADRTAVSQEIVTKLKLINAGGVQLHSVSGISTVSTARISNLTLTRRPEGAVDAAVLDAANMGADGIVGVDLLASQRIQFDFEKQTMSIVPSDSRDFRAEPGTIVVSARRKNGRLIVTDAIANDQRLTVVLDTGSQVSIGNPTLRRRLLGDSPIPAERVVEVESVTGGKLMGEYMFLPKLTIGGITLNNLAVIFTDAHTFKQLGLDRKPALLLGMNAIRAFKKVSIDFANRKFRVVLPQQSALQTELASAALH